MAASTYSHTGFKKPIEYSASAFIGSAIGKLGRDGLLVRVPYRATAFWNYNGMLHGWALTPGPGSEEVLTWKAYAQGLGLDPNEWPLELLK
jgi:hypothetical protein